MAAEVGVGGVVGGFRVDGLVGRGGMGVVFRATQLSLDRSVALKVVAPDLAVDERFRERFAQEARLAASLEHPHLLPVYEAGEEDGVLFLAMKLVEGVSLADALAAEGRLEPARGAMLVQQLAGALEVAHAAGLVHRDVKPANVLVTELGGAEHAFLCDFGLSRRVGGTALTRPEGFVGTAAYAAPEQIRGEPVDDRADVYSLGCVLYECLTGRRPFAAEDELAVMWAHMHNPPPRPSDLDPVLSGFDDVVARALAKDREERSSMIELRRALAEGPAPTAVPPRPPSAAAALELGLTPADPPPASEATPATLTSSLPVPTTAFVGRSREVNEVLALLARDDARLVTLTGPGGTGKTRLALRAATEALAEFPDGVLWVPLATLRDPQLVAGAIARALAVDEQPGARPLDTLGERLEGRRTLVLLDNAEHLLPELALTVSRLLEVAGPVVLVTSRERLQVAGEHTYPVPELAPSDAVELFLARAAAAGAAVEPSAPVHDLCARLENLPLALELAAARTPVLSPGQILERVSQRLDLLKGGRDADPRQQTLRATIEWSYDLLDEEEQRLFRALSVFRGGCTLDAAEQVAGADLDVLQSLVERHLVRYGAERYSMLETIREYALDRLGQGDDRESLAGRHADHYLEAAGSVAGAGSEPLQPAGIRVLDDELDNLRAARAWFHDTRQADAELRLVCALAEFWDLRGHVREGHAAFVAALGCDAPQSPELRAKALADASDFARPLGDVEKARRFAEESLVLFRRLGDDRGIARALHELGEAAGDEEDYDRAVDLFGEAITAARRAGDDGAASTGNLGYMALLQGDYERAASLSGEALALFRRRGHTTGMLVGLGNVAEAELGLGRYEDAWRHVGECLELARETQFLGMILQCLEVGAGLLLEAGDAAAAARLTGAVDALIDEMGLPPHPAERRKQERLRADLRAALGPSAEELRADGATMDAEGASRLVLDALQRSID